MPCIAVVASSVHRPSRSATTARRTSSQTCSESTSTPSRSKTIAAGSIRTSSTVLAVELEKATAVEPLGGGRYGATLDPGWAVAGKQHGGYLLVVLARAAVAEAAIGAPAELPHPAAISAHYLAAPATGPRFTVPIFAEVDVRLDPATAGFAVDRPAMAGEIRGYARMAPTPPDPYAVLVALDILPPAPFDLGLTGSWVP